MWSNNLVGLRQRQRQADSYDSGRRFPASAWTVALVTVPAAAVLFLGYARRHVSDDAMIYSRTVRQIVAGNGPVFNVGERAESSTSVLWQWLLALAHWMTGIEVEQLAIFGGLLLTAAAFVVALLIWSSCAGVVVPMPTAKTSSAMTVKPGVLSSIRAACIASCTASASSVN